MIQDDEEDKKIKVKVLGKCKITEVDAEKIFDLGQLSPLKSSNYDRNSEESVSVIGKTHNERYDKWFSKYIDKLPFSEFSKAEVKYKSEQISKLINESVENLDDKEIWGEGRLRKGMVIGSVQSGKTASMMGIIAKTIDESTKIVVLLSGTKVSLWHQTLLRVYKDLDNEEDNKTKRQIRLILPTKNITKIDQTDRNKIHYSTQQKNICQALEKSDKVLLFIIPKISQHILDLAKVIQNSIGSISDLGKQHMLIIDDESDDASILDARKTKRIPYSITRLWAGIDEANDFTQTHSEDLFATYLAYTATPQANILQSENNPLSPTNFIFSLKTPYSRSDQLNFIDDNGILNYYTGGEIFYEQDFANYREEANFIQKLTLDEQQNPNLDEALRLYLVGAAINLLNSEKKYSDQLAIYESLEEAKIYQVPPYSMIYHPTAIKDDHFMGKQQIIYCINRGTLSGFKYDKKGIDNQDISIDSFKEHFLENEEKWEKCISSFNSTIDFVNDTFDSDDFTKCDYKWTEIRDIIFTEIIPNVKIKVINSSAEADDRPDFEIEEMKREKWKNIPDKLSIFVAGNVLSRGLTIENLAITVFARVSQNPAADTQMQMQRWFGYRGRIIPYCRIFMQNNQLDLFRDYHRSDKSLKERVQRIENNIRTSLEGHLPWILEGQEYRSTLRVDTDKIPLRPANYIQFALNESTEEIREYNNKLIKDFINEIEFNQIKTGNSIIGHISNTTHPSEKIADFLEKLRFSQHSPSLKNPEYRRWKDYAEVYGANYFTNITEEGENISYLSLKRCPYNLAAYLRFWKYVSNEKNIPNNDLFIYPSSSYWKDNVTEAPEFFITIRNGKGKEFKIKNNRKNISINHVYRNLKNNLEFNTIWGNAGGSENQYADKLLDYHNDHNKLDVPKEPTLGKKGIPDKLRPINHPGHLAIYFLEFNNKTFIGLGVGLPSGSPEHIRSMRG